MKEYMSLNHTLYAMALFFGLTQCLDALGDGYTGQQALMKMLLSATIGTILTFGLVWMLLSIRHNQHLTTSITNWFLALGSLMNLLLVGLRLIV